MAARPGLRQRQHALRPAEAHRRGCDHAPALGSDLDRPPALVSEIEVQATRMGGDTNMDRALGWHRTAMTSMKSSAEEDGRRGQRLPGFLVVTAP